MKTNRSHILNQYFEGKALNWKNNGSEDLNQQIRMLSHFPEHFSQKTSIVFKLEEPSIVSLVVYNTELRTLTYLATGLKDKGYHRVEFDASDLPAGTYVARLRTDRGIIKEYMRKVDELKNAS